MALQMLSYLISQFVLRTFHSAKFVELQNGFTIHIQSVSMFTIEASIPGNEYTRDGNCLGTLDIRQGWVLEANVDKVSNVCESVHRPEYWSVNSL